jgi:hypothetical protein
VPQSAREICQRQCNFVSRHTGTYTPVENTAVGEKLDECLVVIRSDELSGEILAGTNDGIISCRRITESC